MLLSACGTNIIHDSCAAYRPVHNYLECPVSVIDQIDINNLTYDGLCNEETTSTLGFDISF